MRNQRRNLPLVLQRRNSREFFGERFQSQLIKRFFVHETGVKVADFLLVGAWKRMRILRCGFDDCAQLALGIVAKLEKRAPTGFVGRDLGGGQPFAVEILEEIVLRANRAVDVFEVDSGGLLGRFAGGQRQRCLVSTPMRQIYEVSIAAPFRVGMEDSDLRKFRQSDGRRLAGPRMYARVEPAAGIARSRADSGC